MAKMFRRGAIAGALTLAICVGALIGGNRSPVLIGFAVCSALFTGGQIWAGRRN